MFLTGLAADGLNFLRLISAGIAEIVTQLNYLVIKDRKLLSYYRSCHFYFLYCSLSLILRVLAVPAPLLLARPSCFSFLFMPLSLQPCPLHANLAEFTQAVFSIGQRLGFRGHNGLLSVFPSLQVTRQQGVACRQLSSSRGERKKSKHSAIRGELFGSN